MAVAAGAGGAQDIPAYFFTGWCHGEGSGGWFGVPLAEGFDLLAGSHLVVLGKIFLEVEEDDLAAGELEGKRHLDEPAELLPDILLAFGRHEEQEESAAAGAQKLAADSAG